MAARFRYYQALLRMLKKDCPAAFPVSVRRVKLSKLEGRCWKQGKTFHIQIDKSLDEGRAMDVLAHDAAWGVAYAEIYSQYERHFTHAAAVQ